MPDFDWAGTLLEQLLKAAFNSVRCFYRSKKEARNYCTPQTFLKNSTYSKNPSWSFPNRIAVAKDGENAELSQLRNKKTGPRWTQLLSFHVELMLLKWLICVFILRDRWLVAGYYDVKAPFGTFRGKFLRSTRTAYSWCCYRGNPPVIRPTEFGSIKNPNSIFQIYMILIFSLE